MHTMKTIDKKRFFVRTVTLFLLLFACFYTYDFYKALSGFVANGFREPLVMLPMILSFLLPVVCFLFFFYDVYVRALHPVLRTLYSVFVASLALADLALILSNIRVYASNNALGVYDALPSIILHFPFDMIVILTALLALQIFHLAVGNRRPSRAGAFLDGLKQRGTLRLGKVEYVALCLLAIVAFIFTGASICGTFTAFSNTFYDFRYLFLLIWVLLCPMGNLVLLVLKPEQMQITKRKKLITLSIGIGANVLFALLFLILELTYPDFLVHLGKPLFLIAFSVSMPIEPALILGITALGTALLTARLVKTARRESQTTTAEN